MTKTKRLLVTVAAAAGVLALATAPQAGAAETPTKGPLVQQAIKDMHLIPAQLHGSAKTPKVAAAPAADVAYLIPSGLNNGRCLDADTASLGHNGTKVQLWTCDTSAANQAFYITQIPEGYLRFQNVANGRYLDADLASINSNGTRVQLWDYVGGAKNQWWGETVIPEGYSRLQNGTSGRYLNAQGSAGGNGTLIQLWDFIGGGRTEWWGQPPA
jgi:hypothetical protein